MKTINTGHPVVPIESNVKFIVLSTSKGVVIIPAHQIIRIQSISNYSKLFLNNGKSLVVAKVLHWFEEQAGLFSFVRIHRSHFVNIQYIKSYSRGKPGFLFLHNGETFSVARRKKAGLIKRLNCINSPFANESAVTSPFNNKKIMAA